MNKYRMIAALLHSSNARSSWTTWPEGLELELGSVNWTLVGGGCVRPLHCKESSITIETPRVLSDDGFHSDIYYRLKWLETMDFIFLNRIS